jgi:predicted transcriptional regulator
MPSPDTRVVTAHLPLSLADQVDDLAQRMERSRGWIVKQALAAYVEREERHRKLTLEAMADVDEGRGVSHAEVKAWAASLSASKPKPLPKWK